MIEYRFIGLIFILFCIFQSCEPKRELKYVYVTFRSGEHYPVRYQYLPEKYPVTENARNNNLTDLGIKSMYNVGKMVRDFYHRKICPIRRTTTSVTGGADPKMLHSALLAYAGIMGKNESEYLEQSYPMETLMKYYNKTIAYVYQHAYVNCEKYKEKLDKAMQAEKSRWGGSYQRELTILQQHHGKESVLPLQLWLIYETYLLQQSYDLSAQPLGILTGLPNSLSMLKDLGEKFPRAAFAEATLKKLGAGQILSHIIKDIERMKNQRFPKDARFTMYAGGALDVAAQFAAFAGKKLRYDKPYRACTKSETGDLKRPDYGAMHIVEVYVDERKQWSVRLLYKDDRLDKIMTKRHVVQIKDCDIFCPLDKLKRLTKDVYVRNDEYDKLCGNPKIDWNQ